MATASETTVLDLLTDRRHIKIDGQRYELRNSEEFSLFEFRRFKTAGARLDALQALDAPSVEEQREYEELLVQLARAVLIAPEAVFARLQPGHCSLVARTFFLLSLGRLQAGATTPTGAVDERSPTRKSARASRVSTPAQRRRTG